MARRKQAPLYAVGGEDLDPDMEVNVEVGATADASTGEVKLQHYHYFTKKEKIADIPQMTNIEAAKHADNAKIKPEEERARKQGASVMMKKFSQHFDHLQSAILTATHHHKDLGKPCACGAANAIYRCSGSEKCSDPPLRCENCILADHKRLPFHRIDRWMDNHFVQTSLGDLGFVLSLGHRGEKCPHVYRTRPRPMVAVHTNGFHKFSVQFCHCFKEPPESEAIQLTNEAYFPGTMEAPATIYSFGLLDNFHAHTLASKKSLYDYHNALVKMTNAAFPKDVANRYTELGQVTRVWAHLAMRRRSGQDHNIDDQLPGRRKSSLAVRCPACPEVGINVDKETIDNAREDEAHKHTLFVSSDGNFRLQRKNKIDDPDDVALNAGNAYFVETEKYQEYVRKTKTVDEDEDSTCAHLRATRLLNVIAFKNAVVSGVVAVQCARHGLFMPQGMVDLQKGEAFNRTDYALAFALRDASLQRWLMQSYDIWCSYQANLKKRFVQFFPKQAELIDKMCGAVPKMHIRNHIAACQLLWSFHYSKYSGETYGEKIESSWGEGNQAAGSTKEMNDGRRHDALDDFHGYWNWLKLLSLAETIYNSYIKCLDVLKTREENFQNFDKCINPELSAKWKAMDPAPRKVKGKVISVHVADHTLGSPPTHLQSYQDLIEAELKRQDTGSGGFGQTQLIDHALRLELDQTKLRILARNKEPTPAEAFALTNGRQSLRRHLNTWRSDQLRLFPHLAPYIKASDGTTPEWEPLVLPSYFNEPDRAKLKLSELGVIEYRLREGRAHDALEKLRTAILVYNANVVVKKQEVFGYARNTRAQGFLSQLQDDKTNSAQEYRLAYNGLLALGLSPTDGQLRKLQDNQLWAKDTSRPFQAGDSKKPDPWYWHVGRPSGMSEAEEEEWKIESDRVKWFRDMSARDRAREEKEILETEIRRCCAYFNFMHHAWTTVAKRTGTTPGHAAYAYQQAEMYKRFENDSLEYEKKIKKHAASYEEWHKEYEPYPNRGNVNVDAGVQNDRKQASSSKAKASSAKPKASSAKPKASSAKPKASSSKPKASTKAKKS